MMGPNCATALVMTDGSFAVFREEPATADLVSRMSDAEYAGSVDVGPMARVVMATDFDDLRDSLRPGSCQACVDGVDLVVRFFTGAGSQQLESQEYEFDPAVDLFAELDRLRTRIRSAGSLDTLTRGG